MCAADTETLQILFLFSSTSQTQMWCSDVSVDFQKKKLHCLSVQTERKTYASSQRSCHSFQTGELQDGGAPGTGFPSDSGTHKLLSGTQCQGEISCAKPQELWASLLLYHDLVFPWYLYILPRQSKTERMSCPLHGKSLLSQWQAVQECASPYTLHLVLC